MLVAEFQENKMYKFATVLLMINILVGCNTVKYSSSNPNIFEVSKHFSTDDNRKGILEANQYCSNLGKEAVFTSETGPSFLVTEFSTYRYYCNDRSSAGTLVSNANNSTLVTNFDRHRDDCLKIGFIADTPDMANCALRLKLFEEEANRRANEYRLAKEEADAERRQRASLKLMEVGLGMISGSGSSGSGVPPAPALQPPSPLIFTSPRGTVICNIVGNFVSCH